MGVLNNEYWLTKLWTTVVIRIFESNTDFELLWDVNDLHTCVAILDRTFPNITLYFRIQCGDANMAGHDNVNRNVLVALCRFCPEYY